MVDIFQVNDLFVYFILSSSTSGQERVPTPLSPLGVETEEKGLFVHL